MAMNGSTAASANTRLPAPLVDARRQIGVWWRGRVRRERLALSLLAAVLGAFLIWSLLVQPAWRTTREAPGELDRLDAEWQQMQHTAAESQTLRATVPVPATQAALALKSATDRLGSRARLTVRSDRATLTLTGVSPDALRAWLTEARSGARARPVEAQLQRAAEGYSGSLTVALGNLP